MAEGMGDADGGSDWTRPLLLRLLDGIKEDIVALREGQSDTDRVARDALGKVEQLQHAILDAVRRIDDAHAKADAAANSLVEIKALAKGAGSTAGAILGAVTGVLGSVLVAWILRALGIG